MRTLTEIDRSERIRYVDAAPELAEARPTRAPLDLHRRLPGYVPTRLVDAAGIAARLGLARLWVKDESSRMGLPAFKIMGASWAVVRAVAQALHATTGVEQWESRTIGELTEALEPIKPMTLTCATDGNHGRAVARMAKLLGLGARIVVPADMAPARIDAIRSEGAEVVIHHGSYDDAVARAAAEADERMLVIADTSWPGYEDVPRWVIEGYSTILWEVDDELARLGEPGPDFVAVQIGVGALAGAVVAHFRRPGVSPTPFILGVEPTHAACAIASIEAGEIVEVPGPHDSIMAGLNCGIPSAISWPLLANGINAFATIDDQRAVEARCLLLSDGIVAGECGAAALAGMIRWGDELAAHLSGKRALIIVTEGITDR